MDALVTYDIAVTDNRGQRRLARVAKICESYGLRVQYSVFECRLSHSRLEQLVNDLLEVIDPRIDSVNIYQFPGNVQNARRSLGRTPNRTSDAPWIV